MENFKELAPGGNCHANDVGKAPYVHDLVIHQRHHSHHNLMYRTSVMHWGQ